MPRKYFTAEQIISKLREAEVLISQGKTAAEASRALSISEQTYYRWRKEYGGMGTEQAHRLKELEKENVRLKRLVAEMVSLDNAILKETVKGNFELEQRRQAVNTVHGIFQVPERRVCRALEQPRSTQKIYKPQVKRWRNADIAFGGVSQPVWSLWLSADHGFTATRRLGRELQTRGALVKAGRPESASQATETGSFVVERRFSSAPETGVSGTCLELRFCDGANPRWTSLSNPECDS